MSGSVFFVAVVVVLGVVLAIVASPIFLVPAAILALGALFAAPLLGAVGAKTAGSDGVSTPSTADATYDPVAQPQDRSAV